MKKSTVPAILFAAISATVSSAGTLYWDANGPAANLGGAGSWTDPAGNWNDSTGTGPRQVWVDGNDAVFTGTASTTATPVIIGAGVTVNATSLTFGNAAGNYLISGGTALNLTNPAASIIMNTNTTGSARAQIIASPIGGTDITVIASQPAVSAINSFVTLGANTNAPTAANQNLFTGNLIFAGTGMATTLDQININNALALPTTATVLMQRDLSQLLLSAGGASGTTAYTATFNNNIKLNNSPNGWYTSGVGSANAGSLITLGGVLSGNADLTIKVGASGGQGTVILAAQNTYRGNTNIATAVGTAISLKLGISNALPQATLLTLGAASAQGNVDLAGFDQAVGGLSSNGNPNATILNSSASLSTLSFNGSATSTYSGALGTSTTNHIALNLPSTNTGTLTLSGTNNYDGGTTVSGGTLLAGSATATGTGPVTVNAGGRLGGGGTVAGPLTSSGTLLPGGTNAAGTLTLTSAATLNAGSSMDLEFSSTTNDKLAIGTSLAVPVTAQSLTLNLADLGSGFKNQTYTLISGTGIPVIDTTATGPLKLGSVPASGAARNATFSFGQNITTNAIELTVSGVGKYLVWRGDGTTGNGDLDTSTPNWDVAAATYAEPDDLTFNDTANGAGPVSVNLPASTNPGRLTFNTLTRNYTLTGSPITGNSSLVKTGTGTLTLSAVDNSTGPIALRGGTLSVDANFNSGAAPLSFEGGTLAPSISINTSRAVTVTGSGTISIPTGADSTLSGPISGTGSLVKTAAGALTTTGAVTVGTLTINGGTLNLAAPSRVGTLAITTSKLDIGSTTLAISNNIAENSLRNFLNSARNTTGNWDGTTGLFSSLAVNDANKIIGIGYFTATDIGLTSLNSIPLSPSDMVVRATYYGDTNNDGKVNADDFAAVDRAFSKGLPARWANGDFNYDGNVTSADYLLMDKSFALQSGPLSPEFLAARSDQFGPDYVSALLASVPEPTSLFAACGLALPALTRRRRR